MGYQSSLHLIDVTIKASALPAWQRATGNRKRSASDPLRFFLQRAVLDADGFLQFTASEDGLDPYEPCEGENTVPALIGKWQEVQEIASWLKRYAEKGGRIVLHSVEADGNAWGWEFDGRGKMRALALRSTGKWE